MLITIPPQSSPWPPTQPLQVLTAEAEEFIYEYNLRIKLWHFLYELSTLTQHKNTKSPGLIASKLAIILALSLGDLARGEWSG